MSLRVEIESGDTQTRRYEDQKGVEQTYEVQICYLHIPGKKYPVEFPRRVPAKGKPLAPGAYVLDFEGAWLNYGFQRIELTLANLKPLHQQQPQQRPGSQG